MLRREFVKGLGAIGAAAMSAGLAKANNGSDASVISSASIDEVNAFRSSLLNIPEAYGPTQVNFNKPLPDGLSGTLYRNGPALFQRGSTEYHHWFDGDGMIQSFQLHGSSLVHNASMINTDRYLAEQDANQFLWPGFGTTFDDVLPVTKADDMNVANISVLPVQDELWALWEGGSAWTVDPDSLKTTGRKVFSEETDGLSFSAHPRVDVGGRIWNFGYVSGADTLIIYDIAASGKLDRVKTIDVPYTNMVHDFAITQQYLIFVLMPITFKWPDTDSPTAFADLLGWDNAEPVTIVMINKSSLELEHRFEMPSFFAFHFGNAWQEGKQVRIELAVSEPFDELNQQITQATQGQALLNPADAIANAPAAIELVIDLQSRSVTVESLPIIGGDFPVFDERFMGSRTNNLTMLNRSSTLSNEIFGFNQLIRFDRRSSGIQSYDYGPNVIVDEHIFVPRINAAEGVGWLLGTSYDWRSKLTSLSVFNAEAVADGPVSTAVLPYHLPLGLHGKFVAT